MWREVANAVLLYTAFLASVVTELAIMWLRPVCSPEVVVGYIKRISAFLMFLYFFFYLWTSTRGGGGSGQSGRLWTGGGGQKACFLWTSYMDDP